MGHRRLPCVCAPKETGSRREDDPACSPCDAAPHGRCLGGCGRVKNKINIWFTCLYFKLGIFCCSNCSRWGLTPRPSAHKTDALTKLSYGSLFTLKLHALALNIFYAVILSFYSFVLNVFDCEPVVPVASFIVAHSFFLRFTIDKKIIMKIVKTRIRRSSYRTRYFCPHCGARFRQNNRNQNTVTTHKDPGIQVVYRYFFHIHSPDIRTKRRSKVCLLRI